MLALLHALWQAIMKSYPSNCLKLYLPPPPRPGYQRLSLRWHNSLITHVSLSTPRFLALCFIMLCRFIVVFFFFFYKLKVCGNLLSSKSFGTIFLTTFACSCLYVTFWWFLQYFKFFSFVIFVKVICDQWFLMLLWQKDYDLLRTQMIVSIF